MRQPLRSKLDGPSATVVPDHGGAPGNPGQLSLTVRQWLAEEGLIALPMSMSCSPWCGAHPHHEAAHRGLPVRPAGWATCLFTQMAAALS